MDDGEETEIPRWWEPYAAEFPGWTAWRAVSGLLHARKAGTDPPLIVSGEDAVDLRDQILRAQARSAE